MPWLELNPKRVPLSELLEEAYRHYGKLMFLSETGHFGCGRVSWLDEVTDECIKATRNDVELKGICIYPVTDRPDWDDLSRYSDCGIWNLDESCNRAPEKEVIQAIARNIDKVLTAAIYTEALATVQAEPMGYE